MKKKIAAIFTSVIGMLAFAVIPAFAHALGTPPFFKVNDKYVGYYPLFFASVVTSTFDLPQDLAPDNYIVNTQVEFVLDTTQLGVPQNIVDNTKFSWDFGDSEKAEGLRNTHVYKKEGSYVLSIFITDLSQQNSSPQLLETLFLNVLPDRYYKLPKAVITVDGKKFSGKVNDKLLFDLNNKLVFDGSSSTALSSKIIAYEWDFGDQRTLTKKTIEYRYRLPQFFATPILRVKDNNGFIADTYVNIQNSGKNDPNNVNPDDNYKLSSESEKSSLMPKIMIFSVLCILAIVIVLVFLKRKKSHI